MLKPEDDIADLYRQFAEQYPLEPGDPGWDELQARMHKNTAEPRIAPLTTKKYWYALAACFLLIITSLTLYLYNWRHTNSQANVIALKKQANTSTATTLPADKAITTFSRPTPGSLRAAAKDSTSPVYTGPGDSIAAASHQYLYKPPVANQPVAGVLLGGGVTTGNVKTYTPQNKIAYAAGTLVRIQGFGKTFTNVYPAIPAGLPGKITGINTSAVTAAKKSVTTHFKKHIYISLVAGPDVSAVKFQGGSAAGFSAGIMAGITLSKNFSLETGLLIDKKNYFSSGKYLDKTTIGITDPDDYVSSVNGMGNFFEVPVIAKVNIIKKRRGNMFVAAGVSSYITHRERYNISIQRPAGQEMRDMDDDDLRLNLFSVMHLSAGYAFKINARSTMQVEPYLKLPFEGIGRSLLPITSTGLYFKYTINVGK